MLAHRFSDLNLPPKNWTFPCSVANLGDIKVCIKCSLACLALLGVVIAAPDFQCKDPCWLFHTLLDPCQANRYIAEAELAL